MAFGGGSFTTQNKVLPGTYINFVSAAKASAELSDRGIAAIAMELDWGRDDEIFTMESRDFETDAREVFGYPFYADELKGIRDLFKNAKTAHFYKLNKGTAAANTYGTAVCGGKRGNALKTVIRPNVDDEQKFDVITYLDSTIVDAQTVADASELRDSGYVAANKEAELAETAGLVFAGGTNGPAITGTEYQTFLEKAEAYSFHTLGCLSMDEKIKGLFAAFTKRMREEQGVKFQTVLYNGKADYEGVINVKNPASKGAESSLVYWVTGACAGCAVNRTLTNRVYDGEFGISARMKQSDLEKAVNDGEFVLHLTGSEIRVLEDVNSLTTFETEKNRDFSSNQVIRVLDQIGNDIAVMFNAGYMGKVQNNEAGRAGLWNDAVTYLRNLETLGSIEEFKSEDVTVEKGMDKKSVTVQITAMPVCAMSKLYMTVTVQ